MYHSVSYELRLNWYERSLHDILRRTRRQGDYLCIVCRLDLAANSSTTTKFVDADVYNDVFPGRRTLLIAATQHCRFATGRRMAEHSAQETDDAGAESLAEIAVNERVDTAVAGTEPLRQRAEVSFEEMLLQAGWGWRVGKHSSQIDGIQREPRCSKKHDDGHQHSQQASLRAPDVGGGTRLDSQISDAPAPDSDANQSVEDADADERQQVAREENHADGKSAKHPRRRPVGVTRDELVAAGDVERSLSVDQDPRHEDGHRN